MAEAVHPKFLYYYKKEKKIRPILLIHLIRKIFHHIDFEFYALKKFTTAELARTQINRRHWTFGYYVKHMGQIIWFFVGLPSAFKVLHLLGPWSTQGTNRRSSAGRRGGHCWPQWYFDRDRWHYQWATSIGQDELQQRSFLWEHLPEEICVKKSGKKLILLTLRLSII